MDKFNSWAKEPPQFLDMYKPNIGKTFAQILLGMTKEMSMTIGSLVLLKIYGAIFRFRMDNAKKELLYARIVSDLLQKFSVEESQLSAKSV